MKEANKLGPRIYGKPGVDVDDLVQEGFWGLYHSALRWSPDRGYTFLTHARSMMRNYMARYISDCESTIRVPGHRRDEIRRLRERNWRTYQVTQHFPGRHETARLIGETASKIDEIRVAEAMTGEMGSLDGGYFEDSRDGPSIYGAGEASWKPIDPAASKARDVETEFLIDDIKTVVADVLAENAGGLTEREVDILRHRFLTNSPRTLQEVGSDFGVTKNRIREIEAKALAKLRRPEVAKVLRDYLHQ